MKNVMKMLTVAMLVAGLWSCAEQYDGTLLKGKVVGAEVEDGLITYYPMGNLYEGRLTEFTTDKEGLFAYSDSLLVEEVSDITIEMSGIGYFGAHVQKGKTIEMTVEKNADGEWQATFSGPDADVSTFVNTFTQCYDQMLYWSPDPSESKPITEYRQLLEDNHKKVLAALEGIENKDTRDYYARLSDSEYRWLVCRMVMDSCENDGTNYKENPEFKKMCEGIDVNDPIHMRTNMAATALSKDIDDKLPGDVYARRMMAATDSLVTYAPMRHQLVQMIGNSYFVYGKGEGDYEQFIKDYVAWAGDDKELAQAMADAFLERQNAGESTKTGMAAPDVELTTPDGKTVKLSSLIRGKFTYIDVWATWCGPCCKEIPFVEKLVEKYKGNDKVQFISISIDQNKDAWLAKLEKDKPQWAQFIIQGETEAQFSKDWAITGIPRFIMINPDGTIFSADATRPSEEKTAQTIDEQIK